MNRRLLIILLSALAISAIASYFVYRLIGKNLTAKTRPQSARVVMANRDLQIGTLIRAADLRTGEWVGPVPKGIALKEDKVVGRGVLSALYEGEPVVENRLAPAGSGGGLAATIPPGMRACAVKVNEVVGVAGFVIPGMRVDVLIAGVPPGNTSAEGPKVKTLLQNIQVLSAGTNIQKDTEGKPVQVQVVNLLVTPEDAEILSLASNETRIQLVLRNPMDTQLSKTSGTAMSNLFSGPEVKPDPRPARVQTPRPPALKPMKRPPASPYLVEVLNGPKRTETKFERPEEQQ